MFQLTTSSAHDRTSSWRSSGQCFLKYASFIVGSSTTFPVSDRINLKNKQRTHGHYISGRVSCLLIIFVELCCSSFECRSKPRILGPFHTWGPSSVKCFQCRNSQMQSWTLFWRECLLSDISILRNYGKKHVTVVTWNKDQHTERRSANWPTCFHSVGDNCRKSIFARFIKSRSCRPISYTKVSICYGQK